MLWEYYALIAWMENRKLTYDVSGSVENSYIRVYAYIYKFIFIYIVTRIYATIFIQLEWYIYTKRLINKFQ